MVEFEPVISSIPKNIFNEYYNIGDVFSNHGGRKSYVIAKKPFIDVICYSRSEINCKRCPQKCPFNTTSKLTT